MLKKLRKTDQLWIEFNGFTSTVTTKTKDDPIPRTESVIEQSRQFEKLLNLSPSSSGWSWASNGSSCETEEVEADVVCSRGDSPWNLSNLTHVLSLDLGEVEKPKERERGEIWVVENEQLWR